MSRKQNNDCVSSLRVYLPFMFVIEQDVCYEPSQYNADTHVHTAIL